LVDCDPVKRNERLHMDRSQPETRECAHGLLGSVFARSGGRVEVIDHRHEH
jgi:hypothetical protein